MSACFIFRHFLLQCFTSSHIPREDHLFLFSKGLLQVKEIDGNLMLSDQCTWSEEQDSLLQTVYCNGETIKETSLQEIRERLWQ